MCALLNLTPMRLGLQKQSILRCADTTGVLKACIIGLGNNRHGSGKIGDRIRLSVRDVDIDMLKKNQKSSGSTLISSGKALSVGMIASSTGLDRTPKGIIVRRRQPTQRKDGSVIRFDDNAYITISKNKPKANALTGPIPFDIRHNSKNLAKILV